MLYVYNHFKNRKKIVKRNKMIIIKLFVKVIKVIKQRLLKGEQSIRCCL